MQNSYQDVAPGPSSKDRGANKTAAVPGCTTQFVSSKTTSLKKTIVGLTFIT